MKLIPLSTTKRSTTKNKDMFAKVDDDKFEYLNQWKWYACKNGNNYYAVRDEIIDGVHIIFWMHRVILGLERGDKRVVDHIDFDGCNNTGENIRICIRRQNASHSRRKKGVNAETKYRGVSIKRIKKFNKLDGTWTYYPNFYYRAMIMFNQKQICLGHYKDELLAAKAYNAGAIKYHGEFAILNDV